MRLVELDWNLPGGVGEVEVDYPDAPIAAFMNWLRRTQRWREDQHAVEERLQRLNATLQDLRYGNQPTATAPAPGHAQITVRTTPVDRLAKAREAKAAKRAARLAAEGGS